MSSYSLNPPPLASEVSPGTFRPGTEVDCVQSWYDSDGRYCHVIRYLSTVAMPGGVLVPFDRSPLSERALEYALERFPDASITTIYVINPVDAVYDVEIGGLPVAKGWQEDARTRAEAIHAAASEIAAEYERELETATVVGRPAREILEYVDEHDLECVVIGSHGRSEEDRAILGRVAETVTRRARIPVTVVR